MWRFRFRRSWCGATVSTLPGNAPVGLSPTKDSSLTWAATAPVRISNRRPSNRRRNRRAPGTGRCEPRFSQGWVLWLCSRQAQNRAEADPLRPGSTMKTSHGEYRQDSRTGVRIPVTVDFADDQLQTNTLNLSFGGIRLKKPKDFSLEP